MYFSTVLIIVTYLVVFWMERTARRYFRTTAVIKVTANTSISSAMIPTTAPMMAVVLFVPPLLLPLDAGGAGREYTKSECMLYTNPCSQCNHSALHMEGWGLRRQVTLGWQ